MLRCWYIFILLFAPRLMALDITRLSDTSGLPLGRELEIWGNRGEPAREEDVLDGKLSTNFSPSQDDYPSIGFSHGEFWARLTLNNPGPDAVTLWLESRVTVIDRVSLFAADSTGRYSARHQGDQLDFNQRELAFRVPAFSLTAAPGTNTYYIRTTTAGANMLVLYLWKAKAFDNHRWLDSAVLMGMLGVLVAMLFYNAFLALSLRSRTYNYYTIFLFFMMSMQFCIMGLPGFCFEHKTGAWLMNEGFIFIANMTGICAITVTSSFLNMREFMPRWHKFCRLLLLIPLSNMLLGFFVPFNIFAALSSNGAGLYSLALISATVVAVFRGYQPARFYCLAWLFVLVATVLNTLHFQGIIHPSLIVQFNSLPGAVLEGLLMSLALADRVNFIRDKSEMTIRQLNAELSQHLSKVEKIVEERTQTIRLILDHVTSGLLIVDRTGVVLGGYSQSCHVLLDQELIQGESLVNLLGLQEDEIAHFRMAMDQVFAELMPLDVCLTQLPKVVTKKAKVLQLGASGVRAQTGELQHVLFTIQDVTELRRRQAESRRNRLLIRILRDMTAFRHFIGTSYAMIQRLKGPIELPTLKFQLHTLKGNSQVFRLGRVARTIHEVEGSQNIDLEQIVTIEQEMEKFLRNNEKLLKVSWGPQKENLQLSIDQANELHNIVASMDNGPHANRLQQWIHDIQQPPIEAIIHPMVASCKMTARRLGKTVDFKTDCGSLRTFSDKEAMIVESLIHFLRNAVVHGIELDREKIGKPPSGHIELSFIVEASGLHIHCKDDGQGFRREDWEEAAQRQLSLSAAAAAAMSLQDLVFGVAQSGFSTGKELSLDAGRGIGLWGLVQLVQEYGGRLVLTSEEGQGTCFDICLPRQVGSKNVQKSMSLSA